jgi:hypothetical protein
MTWALVVSLVVAVLAAAASIVAAVLAFRSARRAQESAEGIARTAHQVAGIDARIERFRSEWATFMSGMGEARTLRKAGALMGALGVLQANPDCTELLSSSAEKVSQAMVLTLATSRPVTMPIDEPLGVCREEVRAIAARLQSLRDDSVSKSLADRRRWGRQASTQSRRD